DRAPGPRGPAERDGDPFARQDAASARSARIARIARVWEIAGVVVRALARPRVGTSRRTLPVPATRVARITADIAPGFATRVTTGVTSLACGTGPCPPAATRAGPIPRAEAGSFGLAESGPAAVGGFAPPAGLGAPALT